MYIGVCIYTYVYVIYICECSCHIDVIGSPGAAFIEPLNMTMGLELWISAKAIHTLDCCPFSPDPKYNFKKYTFFL